MDFIATLVTGKDNFITCQDLQTIRSVAHWANLYHVATINIHY